MWLRMYHTTINNVPIRLCVSIVFIKFIKKEYSFYQVPLKELNSQIIEVKQQANSETHIWNSCNSTSVFIYFPFIDFVMGLKSLCLHDSQMYATLTTLVQTGYGQVTKNQYWESMQSEKMHAEISSEFDWALCLKLLFQHCRLALLWLVLLILTYSSAWITIFFWPFLVLDPAGPAKLLILPLFFCFLSITRQSKVTVTSTTGIRQNKILFSFVYRGHRTK